MRKPSLGRYTRKAGWSASVSLGQGELQFELQSRPEIFPRGHTSFSQSAHMQSISCAFGHPGLKTRDGEG